MSFDPRQKPTRASGYTQHDASGLTIPYAVKSGTHNDSVTFQLEGNKEKARLMFAANGEEQATLILEHSGIEALHQQLGEVLQR